MNQNNSQKLSILEKVGYSFGDLAANLVFQTLVTYLSYFYTDIYGLKTEDASVLILIVGLVAAPSRVRQSASLWRRRRLARSPN